MDGIAKQQHYVGHYRSAVYSQMWRSNFVRLNPFAARFHRSIAQQSRGYRPVLPFILQLDDRREANTDVDTASGVL